MRSAWLALVLFACAGSSLQPMNIPAPASLEWCINAVTERGSVVRVCTEHEVTCRWIERGARTYGKLAELSQIGSCTN